VYRRPARDGGGRGEDPALLARRGLGRRAAGVGSFLCAPGCPVCACFRRRCMLSTLSETPSERRVSSLSFSLLPPPASVYQLPECCAHSVSPVPLLCGRVALLPPLPRPRHLAPQFCGCLFFRGSVPAAPAVMCGDAEFIGRLCSPSRERRRSDRRKTWHDGYGGAAATWTLCTQPKTTPCWLLTRR